jgi:hypothetical protein
VTTRTVARTAHADRDWLLSTRRTRVLVVALGGIEPLTRAYETSRRHLSSRKFAMFQQRYSVTAR